MSGNDSQSPSDDYFNDLSRQPPELSAEQQDEEQRGGSQDDTANGQIPKTKRIACVLCRKRKLKCDGSKPACGTCSRLQHDCSYDEVRRKSGPKRGYVKALEARLAQVETLLKTQDEPNASTRIKENGASAGGRSTQAAQNGSISMSSFPGMVNGNGSDARSNDAFLQTISGYANAGNNGRPAEDSFPWEMIGLGLDEPLPTQDVVNELDQAYFDKCHPSLPMVHRPRYYAAMNLPPHMRPPICLRYAMWCMAASVTDKYEAMQDHFYQRARKYIQQDEMRGHGEGMITVAHCQAWVILCTYEFKHMYFPRAWMSAGRATRHAQMMGLHRLDGSGLEVKQCLPPPKDWTEREERRRTFWASYCIDRYASIGTGWPMSIDERDILSHMPDEEEAYESGIGGTTCTLDEGLEPGGINKISSFGGAALMACLFGRNLTHLHRPTPDDDDQDLNGEFWRRHRRMDNVVLNLAMSLPDRLRLPEGINNANIIFLNMCVHTSAICLHQAAIFKADKGRMPGRVSAESKVRCITAAAETASIMRQISHLDLSVLNPFISFCLYVAARVFVQYLKSRPKDAQIKSSLQFLLSAMHAIKRKNPLTESFLVQLDVDLEGAGLEDSAALRATIPKSDIPSRASGCPMEEFMGFEPINKTASYKDAAPVRGEFPGRVFLAQTGIAASGPPTYGDRGLAAFSEPNQPADAFGYTVTEMDEFMVDNTNNSQFELPTRQRTPGGSNVYRSPQSNNNIQDMGMSPDSNSNGDMRTNGSMSQQNAYSSHTSHTGYSPQNTTPDMNKHSGGGTVTHDANIVNNMFGAAADSNNAAFNTDFDMAEFVANAGDAQHNEFALPQDWNSTGMTPNSGAGGGVSGSINGMGEMMGMTDADWSRVVNESFPDWETNQGRQDRTMQDTMYGARTRL
ncbi:Hypothetical protein R9X50_00240500 [Acrodontium crateriforme]|uniref:Zn(2)-C6 fungal-type domain-containing protein n=1 Tax=Acrodontium crateriforme TaxID=150365 RepID=A0AAQ3M3T7_9PEZI|nr:Hypothetical protein R9X50_00240500 [Acrodontium crateriforme]